MYGCVGGGEKHGVRTKMRDGDTGMGGDRMCESDNGREVGPERRSGS